MKTRPNPLRYLCGALLLLCCLTATVRPASARQQPDQPLKFDKTAHNFGQISISEGPNSCTFTFTNTGDKPVVINNVLTSCGCTEPVWPKAPVMPGKSGTIQVTYLNDQGPYPFDKSITVYTSASPKPIILRISGVAYEKNKTLKDLYPVRLGPLGIRSDAVKIGQIEQGESKSQTATVANLSGKEVKLSFTGISEGLSVQADPAVIPAGGTAQITLTVNTAVREHWGNTIYTAYPVCNGTKADTPVQAHCMIIEAASKLSAQEKNDGPMVVATGSSVNLGRVPAGRPLAAEFKLRNTGARDLVIHTADVSDSRLEVVYPKRIPAGEDFQVSARTAGLPGLKGEQILTITLVTNSPLRPLVNLFFIVNIQ